MRLKRAYEDTQRQVQEQQQELDEINTDQKRMRDNMDTVAKNSAYYFSERAWALTASVPALS
jgi:hypothetical protein